MRFDKSKSIAPEFTQSEYPNATQASLDGRKMGMNAMENTWMTDQSKKSRQKMDFLTMLNSVTWIWQIAGNFPMSFLGPRNMKKCRFSKILMGFQILLFFICVVTISTALCSWAYIVREQAWVMAMAVIIRIFSCLCYMVINCFMWIIYRKDFVDAVEFLASQSLILNQLGCRPDYTSCLRIIKTLVYGMLTIILLVICFDLLASLHHWPAFTIPSFLQWFFWNFPLLVQVMTSTIFCAFVMILGLHFRELNVKMAAVRDRNNSSSPKVIEVSNGCAESVRLIAKVHYNLCKISKFINRLFNANLVVTVVTAFFILSSSLYFIFNEVVKDAETDYWAIGNYISWEITTALPIIVTVIICNLTSNEIRSLSLQLHHQKIEFTGAGLFPINSSLLQTMIGNMTTSLVILIQFQPSLDSD